MSRKSDTVFLPSWIATPWARLRASATRFWRQVRPLVVTMFDRQNPDALSSVVSAFESETTAVMVRTTPRSEHTILYSVTGMIFLTFVLMSIWQLDIVVTGVGRIVPTTGSIEVSPWDRAIVNHIFVKVGESVHKGQVLATMDPTFAKADLIAMQQHVDSDVATVAREQAQLADKPYVPAGNGPYETLQLGVWRQQEAAFNSSVADFDARINAAVATVKQNQDDIDNYGKLLADSRQEEQMNIELEQKGYGSKLRTLTATDARVAIERELADSAALIEGDRQTVLSLKAQKSEFVKKWYSDLTTQLVSDKNDLDRSRDSLTHAQKYKDLVDVRAPVDGFVLKIDKVSPGSITGTLGDSSQEPMFTITPVSTPIEAEIDIDSKDQGFVHPGNPVTIKLDAYQYIRYGTASGVLKKVSEGSFELESVTNQPVAPYFELRAAITGVHLHDVPRDFHLIPGMTLVADIVVAHRSIMSYLVESVLKTGSEAMREP
jgi:hemolysin D